MTKFRRYKGLFSYSAEDFMFSQVAARIGMDMTDDWGDKWGYPEMFALAYRDKWKKPENT